MNTNPRRTDEESIENLKKMIASGCLTNHEQSVLENLVKEFEAPLPSYIKEKKDLAKWLWDNCSDKETGYREAPWLDIVDDLKQWLFEHGWKHE